MTNSFTQPLGEPIDKLFYTTFYTTFRRTSFTNRFAICVIDFIYAFGYANASEATMYSIAHSGVWGVILALLIIFVLFGTAYMQLDLSRIE